VKNDFNFYINDIIVKDILKLISLDEKDKFYFNSKMLQFFKKLFVSNFFEIFILD